MKFNLFIVFLVFVSCKNEKPADQIRQKVHTAQDVGIDSITTIKKEYTTYEDSLLQLGLLDAGKIEGVIVHLQYATSDNFTQQQLYHRINHAFLRPIAYKKLEKAVDYLQQEYPNYGLLIYDALRPNAIQHKMWAIVKGTPQQKYVASPYRGSIHNFGCAVDLTIIDLSNQKVLDMGSPYDYFGAKAEYRYNDQLMRSGEITKEAYQNRILLRRIMKQASFQPINSEWWHFNALNKNATRQKFTMIK